MLPLNAWGDREHARRRFLRRQGRRPGGERFTDRLYEIKTDGSLLDPSRQFCTDKEYAKQYVEMTLGPGYVPKTYRVLRSAAEVMDFVPDRVPCVVKPTHLSGSVIFHTDPDRPPDRDLLLKWLDTHYYGKRQSREGNYRHLRPKIIVEEFLSEDGVTVPKDYKLFCFHGVPKLVQVDCGRFQEHRRNLYDDQWARLPVTYAHPNGGVDQRPAKLAEMLTIAAQLAAGFSFVRVDLYVASQGVRVGELTFCPGGANEVLAPAAADIALGKLFDPGYRLDARSCAEAWAPAGGS